MYFREILHTSFYKFFINIHLWITHFIITLNIGFQLIVASITVAIILLSSLFKSAKNFCSQLILKVSPKITIMTIDMILIGGLTEPTPEDIKDKNTVYVFDSEDKFELTYDELVAIIGKARQAGPRMIPVLGTVN